MIGGASQKQLKIIKAKVQLWLCAEFSHLFSEASKNQSFIF